MRKFGLTLLLLSIISYQSICFAFQSLQRIQTDGSSFTIQGHITDESGSPLDRVTLSVKWKENESLTDKNGTFTVFNVNDGDTIIANHESHISQSFVVKKNISNYFINLKAKHKKILVQKVAVRDSISKKSQWKRNITGIVYGEDKKGLSDATVIAKETKLAMATDSTGSFELLGLSTNDQLVVSHVGFESQEFKLDESKTTYSIYLKKKQVQLGEIVIVGYATSKESTNSLVSANNYAAEMVIVEQNPEFPGGNQALILYIARNILYPAEARREKIQGRINVSFTVNEAGNIRSPKISQKIGFGIDEEIMRVVLNMPKWSPAKQNNKPVAVEYILPLQFFLEK
ncbi:TonB family protein [Dyadobacter sp. CY312]|uniref:TonB family protein n=1 Tax=Dyadobacter sp. CY312 TaxID=2907303 RepID=UPI001F3DEA2F|nr:TonB family protein [Dyadobacter sp. CY312]MCE7041981.1 TonB family protein [Dyadobacter sp. CY312]